MDLKQMYKGLTNSPETVIASSISFEDTVITVANDGAIPDAPNILVLGGDTDDPETVLLVSKDGNLLTVSRSLQGTARDWAEGTKIARNFTAYDYDALVDNVESLGSHIGTTNYITLSTSDRTIPIPDHIEEGIVKFNVEGKTEIDEGKVKSIEGLKIISEDTNGENQTYAFVSEGLYSLPNGIKDILEGSTLTKKVEKIILDEKLSWGQEPTPVPNSRRVFAFAAKSRKDMYIGYKYNGETLSNIEGGVYTKFDELWIDPTSRYIALILSNADTGWGNDYAPTTDEIKAYFLGWKMFEDVAGLPPYNGTGMKKWAKIWCGQGTNTQGMVSGTSTNIVPVSINDMGYTPYQLYYELETPEIKEIDLSGLIARKNGQIRLENWNRRVLKFEDIEAEAEPGNIYITTWRTRTFHDVTFIDGITDVYEGIYIRNKRYIPWNNGANDNVSSIGSYYTWIGGAILSRVYFVLPKGITMSQAKQLLAGIAVYYKVDSEYEVTPDWSVEIPTTVKAQIVKNTGFISEVSRLVQANKDLILNSEKKTDNMVSELMSKSGGTFTGIVTAHSNTSYTVKQIRNIILSPNDADVNAMEDSDIWIKYK